LYISLVGCTSVSREAHDFTGNLLGFVNDNKGARQQYKAVLEIDKVHALNKVGGDCDNLLHYDRASGRPEEGINDCEQTLEFCRGKNDELGEAFCLNLLGTSYLELVNRRDKAIECSESALAIYRAHKLPNGEGEALGNLGRIYDSMSQYGKAIDCFEQSMMAFRKSQNNPIALTDALSWLGIEYNSLGQPEKALGYFKQALALQPIVHSTRFFPSVKVPDLEHLAICDDNMGRAYSSLGQHKVAIQYYKRAIPNYWIFRDGGDADRCLNRLGREYEALGEHEKALWCYKMVFVPWANPFSWKSIQSRDLIGSVLRNLGSTYESLGRHEKALDNYNRALSIMREVKDQPEEANTLEALMEYWKNHEKPDLAVFYGKQAVNVYQEIRGNIQELDPEIRKSFLASHESTYRALGDLLIAEGRLPEAEHVLNLLKEEEFLDFVRRDETQVSSHPGPVEMGPKEAEWEKRYDEIADQITVLGTERGLLRDKRSRTADEDRRLTALAKDLEVANLAFQKQLNRMAKEASFSDGTKDKLANVQEEEGLMETLRELGPGVVVLYTLVGQDKYYVILITANTRTVGEFPINSADLGRKVLEFRQVLQDRGRDPMPLAQELYRILVGPISHDLDGAKAKTLMWSLDGVLRYVPMAALNDGQHYLVERYRNVVFTPASESRLNDAVSSDWKGLGLGVSKAREGFPGLPGVAEELQGIFGRGGASSKDAVLPGVVLLDEKFTADTMLAALNDNYSLVHIASHFNFHPGNEVDSFLLLGDGSHLTLDRIKNLPQVFAGVELLTLSACNTAVGGAGADGKEVEGFGVLAQRQGAEAVMASLWPVADDSTEQLMREFYRIRQAKAGTSKAEALRQAQMELLCGSLKSNAQMPDSRGIRQVINGNQNVASYQFDSQRPFAHPYYWGPFILIGNWK
jgi:CHAT domain-containing protein